MKKLFALFCLSALAVYPAVTFVKAPSLTKDGDGKFWIEFELSELADVEVSVVDLSDSSVVRHLAAGVLGANAPAPFAKNTAAQNLEWDAKDDLGNVVASPESLVARVRAKMSPMLNNFAGENNYIFGGVNGLSQDEEGNIYVIGLSGTLVMKTIRKYDGNGNYLATVYPPPAGYASSRMGGYGINTWLNGSYNPKVTYVSQPQLGSALVSNAYAGLMANAIGGELMVVTPSLQALRMGVTGELPDGAASFSIITSPALPTGIGGPVFVTLSPDKKYFLVSGLFQTISVNTKPAAAVAGDWADGQVFKVDASTGVAVSLVHIDSVPSTWEQRSAIIGPAWTGNDQMRVNTAAIHGTCFDDSGRIFVCDRWNRRVSVYDTLGTLLGGVTVDHPDLVEVNKTTGELYVVTRQLTGYHTGVVNIKKFSGWRPGDTLVTQLRNFVTQVGDVFGKPKAEKVYMAVSQSGAKPVIWFTSYSSTLGVANQNNVWAIRDDGDTLTVIRDFYSSTVGVNSGFDRLAVDRKRDIVYRNDAWSGLYQLDDWDTKAWAPCSTSANRRLSGTDLTVSFDGQLYVREGTGYSGPITRYTTERVHAPVPFANTGTNVLTPYIYSRYGAGFGERGLAVAPDKHVAVMYMYGWSVYFVGCLGDSGQRVTGDTTGVVDSLVLPIHGSCGGVKYDLKGNLYMGQGVYRDPAHVIPSGFSGDPGYNLSVGSIIRFPAGAKGSVQGAPLTVTGADKVYLTGYGPFSGPLGPCWCRNPRFDLDPYGRLYIPNGITSKVRVVDNEENLISEFGEYGNMDSRGAGSAVPGPAFPLAMPIAVAASEDFIYVNDIINCRLMQVKMDYELDNYAGLTLHGVASEFKAPKTRALSLSAMPNPFNPACRLVVSLPSRENISLSIYDLRGRLMRPLFSGARDAGEHAFVWNAGNAPAGMYLFRLEAGKRTLIRKVILAK